MALGSAPVFILLLKPRASSQNTPLWDLSAPKGPRGTAWERALQSVRAAGAAMEESGLVALKDADKYLNLLVCTLLISLLSPVLDAQEIPGRFPHMGLF